MLLAIECDQKLIIQATCLMSYSLVFYYNISFIDPPRKLDSGIMLSASPLHLLSSHQSSMLSHSSWMVWEMTCLVNFFNSLYARNRLKKPSYTLCTYMAEAEKSNSYKSTSHVDLYTIRLLVMGIFRYLWGWHLFPKEIG